MYNSAITQGELELYKAQIDDANKRNTLLQGYHTMCPEPQVKNEKRKTFYIAKYREVDTVLHDTYRDDFGRVDVIKLCTRSGAANNERWAGCPRCQHRVAVDVQ